MSKIYCEHCDINITKSYYHKHLRTKKHNRNIKTKEKDKLCSICLEYILDNDSHRTSCNHYFHKSCLDKWFRFGNTCPYCRCELTQRTIIRHSSLPPLELLYSDLF